MKKFAFFCLFFFNIVKINAIQKNDFYFIKTLDGESFETDLVPSISKLF